MKDKILIHKLWDGTKVYLVHGKDIRDNYDTKWIGGGHGYRYDYIPKDEIWLEIQEDREDMKEILVHEITEYIFMRYEGKNYDDSHDIANIIEDTLRAIPDSEERPLPSEPPQEEGKDNPIESDGSKIKVSFVKKCPGHKNSHGESAPFCIVDHSDGHIISSHKTEEEAKSHLQDMHIHKKGDKYMNFRNIKSIEELLKKAEVDSEGYTVSNTQIDADGRPFKMEGGEVQYLLPNGNWSSTPPLKKEDPEYTQGGNDTVEYPKKSQPSIREFAESTKGTPGLRYPNR